MVSNKVLVIAPHADDEVLGCGASIAGHVYQGDDVKVVIVTNAHKGDANLFSKDSIDIVRNEALMAHSILGVQDTIFLDFPAPRLDSYPNYKISLELSKIIKDFNPSILYLPHPGDLHLDHKSTYRASLVAARPQNCCSISEIYCYETLSETDWSPMQGDEFFKPNYFSDITIFFDKKIQAMECFSSQLKDFPHPRSLKNIEYLAGYRGATVGVKRAEAFEVERIINSFK